MKQLTGLDASFLYMETATTFGHVSGLGIYERPTPEFDPYQVVYERFGALVGQAEPMRRKLVEVPFSLDHPWWIDDAEFDLDYHAARSLLVVDNLLPAPADLPTLEAVHYVSSLDDFEEQHIPQSRADARYDEVLCKVALRTVREPDLECLADAECGAGFACDDYRCSAPPANDACPGTSIELTDGLAFLRALRRPGCRGGGRGRGGCRSRGRAGRSRSGWSWSCRRRWAPGGRSRPREGRGG